MTMNNMNGAKNGDAMIIAIDAREMVGPIAGKGRYVTELVKALATIDKTNTYYLYSKRPLKIDLPNNFKPILIGGWPGWRQLWLALDVKKRGCDVLFAPTGYLPVLFSFIPCVVAVHDLAVFVSKEAKPALKTYIAEKLLLGLAVSKSRHIICVSQNTKNDLGRIFRVPVGKISVTLLGYDRTVYKPRGQEDDAVHKQYKLSPNYLLFLGTLEPRKNIVGLLKAYGQLPTDLRHQYPLVIGGKKGWYYDSIFTTVKDLKLTDSVIFLGRVPDEHLPALYRQAKLFLFPSFYEGFGLPPLEAMACGTPVIASNTSSLPEVIGQAGRLINPHDIDELAETIKELLTNPELYYQLKTKTTVQASTFDWQKTAEQTLAVFKQVARQVARPNQTKGQPL